jgi:hypothetical protein
MSNERTAYAQVKAAPMAITHCRINAARANLRRRIAQRAAFLIGFAMAMGAIAFGEGALSDALFLTGCSLTVCSVFIRERGHGY